MKYDRFRQLWVALVEDRKSEENPCAQPTITNGISDELSTALLALADGDNRYFDRIQADLPEYTLNK